MPQEGRVVVDREERGSDDLGRIMPMVERTSTNAWCRREASARRRGPPAARGGSPGASARPGRRAGLGQTPVLGFEAREGERSGCRSAFAGTTAQLHCGHFRPGSGRAGRPHRWADRRGSRSATEIECVLGRGGLLDGSKDKVYSEVGMWMPRVQALGVSGRTCCERMANRFPETTQNIVEHEESTRNHPGEEHAEGDEKNQGVDA